MLFHLPWLEVSLLFSFSQALFWAGVLRGLVCGVVQEADDFPAVEGGGARRDVCVGEGGGVQESQVVALCNQPPCIHAVP